LKPDRPGNAGTVPFAREGQRQFCEIARTETQTSPSKRGPHYPPKRTVRSFNFSRLARSTCCQRPRHLTPERGDSVGRGPNGPLPRNSRAHTSTACAEKPYNLISESLDPSTRAPVLFHRQESTCSPHSGGDGRPRKTRVETAAPGRRGVTQSRL